MDLSTPDSSNPSACSFLWKCPWDHLCKSKDHFDQAIHDFSVAWLNQSGEALASGSLNLLLAGVHVIVAFLEICPLVTLVDMCMTSTFFCPTPHTTDFADTKQTSPPDTILTTVPAANLKPLPDTKKQAPTQELMNNLKKWSFKEITNFLKNTPTLSADSLKLCIEAVKEKTEIYSGYLGWVKSNMELIELLRKNLGDDSFLKTEESIADLNLNAQIENFTKAFLASQLDNPFMNGERKYKVIQDVPIRTEIKTTIEKQCSQHCKKIIENLTDAIENENIDAYHYYLQFIISNQAFFKIFIADNKNPLIDLARKHGLFLLEIALMQNPDSSKSESCIKFDRGGSYCFKNKPYELYITESNYLLYKEILKNYSISIKNNKFSSNTSITSEHLIQHGDLIKNSIMTFRLDPEDRFKNERFILVNNFIQNGFIHRINSGEMSDLASIFQSLENPNNEVTDLHLNRTMVDFIHEFQLFEKIQNNSNSKLQRLAFTTLFEIVSLTPVAMDSQLIQKMDTILEAKEDLTIDISFFLINAEDINLLEILRDKYEGRFQFSQSYDCTDYTKR